VSERRESGWPPFVHIFFGPVGGTGAMPTKDGESCVFPSNGRATSVETTERLVPVVFECRELIPDSAGAGRYRGGLGARWTIRNRGSDPLVYSGQVGRLRHPALGILGGDAGSPNRLFVNGEPEERGWGRWELAPGDAYTKEVSGGGGLGSPLLREQEAVLEDVLEGFVSADRARDVYGIVIEDGSIRGFTPARAEG
jgi:N-methylhydantoinase B